MRKFVVVAFLAAIATAAPVQAAQGLWTALDVKRLRADVAEALASPVLRGAHVGVLIVNTASGRVLYAHNADGEFQPASNFKLLVGSAALDRLGAAFQFNTSVTPTGTVTSGRLAGDLVLTGGGDAQLSAGDLNLAAAAVSDAGIRSAGSVRTCGLWQSDRLPPGWDWDDLPYYYAPVVSPLSLQENVVHVFVSPGDRQGDPVKLRIVPQSAAFTIDNHATTGAAKSKDTTDVERPWDQPRTIRVVGSYPLGSKESDDLQPAVPDPNSYAADVFLSALEAHGISIEGGVDPTCPQAGLPSAGLLWKHPSERMPRLLADFWQPSDNLMGELFFNKLGGATAEQAWLRSIGVDPQTVSISDGSGLSNYDRITPRALVAILQHDWNGRYRAIVLNALPVAGVSGTLEDAYKGTAAEKNVIAKTGTISHVRTISGFIRTRRHGMLTFSFLINDWVQDDTPNGPDLLAKLRGALLSRIVTN